MFFRVQNVVVSGWFYAFDKWPHKCKVCSNILYSDYSCHCYHQGKLLGDVANTIRSRRGGGVLREWAEIHSDYSASIPFDGFLICFDEGMHYTRPRWLILYIMSVYAISICLIPIYTWRKVHVYI